MFPPPHFHPHPNNPVLNSADSLWRICGLDSCNPCNTLQHTHKLHQLLLQGFIVTNSNSSAFQLLILNPTMQFPSGLLNPTLELIRTYRISSKSWHSAPSESLRQSPFCPLSHTPQLIALSIQSLPPLLQSPALLLRL